MSLHLLHCAPDARAMATWATRHRLLSPDGDDGYALHALLTAAFGEQAPKPFRYLGAAQGLLAYTSEPPETLRESAVLAPPDIDRALGLEGLAFKAFPMAWRPGQTLAFEVRVRPVIRVKDGRERDLFLHAIEGSSPAERTADREAVYVEWLRKQLTERGAVDAVEVGMDAFRLSRVIRRAKPDTAGRRKPRPVVGPDAVFKGQLRVADSDAFTALLQRGIGRHRAFGFGMLLLKPARSC